jgi:pyridoxine 5-phosphate synthase
MRQVQPIRLGVNLDHVATVRQARRTTEPDPVRASILAEIGGADQITIHLREDRRHIQDHDLQLMREVSQLPLNQEMGVTEEMLEIALAVKPDIACLVPEKREEVTTEGGLDIVGNKKRVQDAIKRLHDGGIAVSLFIDPTEEQVRVSRELGADAVELHTGEYANSYGAEHVEQLMRLRRMAELGSSNELHVHAGHGLTYQNAAPVAGIPEITELNIGHSIIARSLYVGLQQAVAEMRSLMDRARTDARLGAWSHD